MLTGLVLIKIVVTLGVVIALSLIAEHVSARLAGVLAGFPHGLAIVLFFIGHEQGAEFAAKAAVAAVGGLAANMAHALGFGLAAKGCGWGSALRAAAGGIAAFAVVAAGLKLAAPGPVLGATITVATLALASLLTRGGDWAGVSEKPRFGLPELLIRAGVAAVIVLAITSIAAAVGPRWAGLLSGFPVVTFPLFLLIQARHGAAPVATMVRAYPLGLSALVVYTLAVAWLFPQIGMGWGTAAGLAASLGWMALVTFLRAALRNRYKSER